MYNMKKEKYIRRSPRKNIAFYISLALCVAAVAGAAWNTYGSIDEYYEDDIAAESESDGTSEAEAANDEVSGVEYPESEQPEESRLEPSDENSEISSNVSEADAASRDSTESKRTFRPVSKGDIIKKYSPEDPVYSETMKDWRTHNGIDISGAQGTSVHAVQSGVVTEIKEDPLLGNVICIKSSTHEIYYCGMTNVSLVEEGANVSSGETIGYIGSIPSEVNDEPHLHLEATKDGEHIDPATLF